MAAAKVLVLQAYFKNIRAGDAAVTIVREMPPERCYEIAMLKPSQILGK